MTRGLLPPPGRSPALRRLGFIGALMAGLVLRLVGLLFNGMLDLDEIIIVWGAEVSHDGLGTAFGINYGLLSYAFFGIFYDLAAQMPRFWWVPYKLAEIAFEAVILACLFVLLPRGRRGLPLVLYWLNPWFILHGAWQGFWEGPYVAFALLAVLVMRRLGAGAGGWLTVGLMLMGSAMFKPQGLAFFVAPVGLYLAMQFLWRREPAVFPFAAGVGLLTAAATLWIVLAGGAVTAIFDNYLTVLRSSENICNECLNLWRPVAHVLMQGLGQSGFSFQLRLPASVNSALHAVAAILMLALLLLMAWRIPLPTRGERPAIETWPVLLLVLAIASLVMSQFMTRAHVNHGYAALVLMIPLLPGRRPVAVAWALMVAVQFYVHLGSYGLGRALVMPHYVTNHEAARAVISGIEAQAGRLGADELLAWQARANAVLEQSIPAEPIVSMLAIAQVTAAVYVLTYLLGRPAAGGRSAP